MEIHLRHCADFTGRIESIVSDLEFVAMSDDSDTNGEVLEALDRTNFCNFYEPAFKCLSARLDGLRLAGFVPKRSGAKKQVVRKTPGGFTIGDKRNGKSKRRTDGHDEIDDDEEEEEEEEEDGEGESVRDQGKIARDAQQHDQEDDEKEQDEGDTGATPASRNSSASSEPHTNSQDSGGGSKRKRTNDTYGTANSTTTDSTLHSSQAAFLAVKNLTFLLMHLVLITRSLSERKTVLSVAVKQGRIFVEKFLKQAIPFLNVYYKLDNKGVQVTLKHVQKASRQLSAICEFGKQSKDSAMMGAIPKLRRLVESLTYSAKQLCNSNNCIGLFSTASLKRRGVDGELVEGDGFEQEDMHEGGDGRGSATVGGGEDCEQRQEDQERAKRKRKKRKKAGNGGKGGRNQEQEQQQREMEEGGDDEAYEE